MPQSLPSRFFGHQIDWHATRLVGHPSLKSFSRPLAAKGMTDMLRITLLNPNGLPAIVKLEGKLLEPWISELQDACRTARKQDAAATLDVAGLSYIDAPGTIALRDLMRRGVALTGCSPLIAELLKETER
jgi:hypothetical protein